MNQLSEQFELLQKAKRLEKIGNPSSALKTYLELHDNYNPNTYDSFERPIILLEKFKRYDEAIDLCMKAIELVKEGKISGTVDRFESRLIKLEEKNHTLEKPAPKTKKKTKKTKKTKNVSNNTFNFFSKKKKNQNIKVSSDSDNVLGKTKTHLHDDQDIQTATDDRQKHNHTSMPSKVDKVSTNSSNKTETDTPQLIAGETVKVDRFRFKTMFHKTHRTFTLIPPGFRSKKKQNMLLASSVYLVALAVSLPKNYFLFISFAFGFIAFNYFLDLLGYKSNNKHGGYTFLAFIVSIAVVFFASGSVIYNQYNSLASGEFDASQYEGTYDNIVRAPLNESELPLITDEHIKIAIDDISKESFVTAGNIIVEGKTVSFGLLVQAGTSKEEAEVVGKKFVKVLSSIVASNYSDVSPPDIGGFGELFDDYHAMITVGTSSDNIISSGVKGSHSLGFRWTD